jgi:hypothetical protein
VKPKLLNYGLSLLTAGAALFGALAPARAGDKKPNIVVIWGDDIGMWNVGAYTHGMMGRTPNIDFDRQGRHPLHRSLRSAQSHGRLRRVHHWGNAHSHGHDDHRHSRLAAWNPEERPDDCGSAQVRGLRHRAIRQNHLGDRNEFLPTAHGFDEWFGNLYHLNAEEEAGSRDGFGRP